MSGIYSYILSFFGAKNNEVPAKKESRDKVDSGETTQSDAQPIPNLPQHPRRSAASINQSNPKLHITEGNKIIIINGEVKNAQFGDHNAMLIRSGSNKKSRAHSSSASNYNDQNPNDIVIKKSTELYPDSYKMSSEPRGHMLIINNHFFNNKKLQDRTGSDKDIFKLNLLFKLLLNFDVQVKQQLTADGIYKEIKSFANSEQHKKTDSCILCIMSHGNEYGVFGTDNCTISIEQILSLFKNKKNLSGKPKLFLFQTCRGTEMNVTVQSDSPSGTDSTYVPPEPGKYQSLQLGDFLIGNATIPGYQSLRNSNNGSWFITAIFTEFINHAYNTDMLGLTYKVNRNVTSISKEDKMQQPEWHTSLNKKWYLYPGL